MTTTSPRSEFWAGVRAELPIIIGVLPFGMIFGVLAADAGLSPIQSHGLSWIVFAGSAQFVGVNLISEAAPALILWVTTFIINLRHMLYSADLGPRVQHLSQRWRWLLAYLLTDEAYVVTALRYEDESIPDTHKHFFWLGSGLTLWGSWQLSTIAGIFLGEIVRSEWSLDFTLALTFIGMVVPNLKDRPNLLAAIASGLVAVAFYALPYRLGVLLAALAGIIVGLLAEGRINQEAKG